MAFLRKEFSILFKHVQGWTRFRGLELLFYLFCFYLCPLGYLLMGLALMYLVTLN